MRTVCCGLAVTFALTALLGCASPRAARVREVNVKLVSRGRIVYAGKAWEPKRFAAALDRRGISKSTLITLHVQNRSLLPLIQPTFGLLAECGYCNLVFVAPRRAVVVPSGER